MTDPNNKNQPSIELAEYQRFQALFKEGHFGSQRYGQAFHSHFSLHKMTPSEVLAVVYESDGSEAKDLISHHFDFH